MRFRRVACLASLLAVAAATFAAEMSLTVPAMTLLVPFSRDEEPGILFQAAALEVHVPVSRSIRVGLATGIGKVSPRRCAGHMRVAWRQLKGRPRIPSYGGIHKLHRSPLLAE